MTEENTPVIEKSFLEEFADWEWEIRHSQYRTHATG